MYLYLIEKPKKPKGHLIVFTHFGVVSGVYGVGVISNLTCTVCIADAKFPFFVYNIKLFFAALVHQMVFPKDINEERFHDHLFVGHYGIDGVKQV